MKKPLIIITGASSGIGATTATHVALYPRLGDRTNVMMWPLSGLPIASAGKKCHYDEILGP